MSANNDAFLLTSHNRKNSGFYKTSIGAEVGDICSSVLVVYHENGLNAFDYLCAVQRHAVRVRKEPERWMPWNYPAEPAEA